jgi:hypothetical protein
VLYCPVRFHPSEPKHQLVLVGRRRRGGVLAGRRHLLLQLRRLLLQGLLRGRADPCHVAALMSKKRRNRSHES